MTTPATAPAGDPTLAQLAADYWDWRLAESPVMATQLGDHRWDDRLPDESPAGRERRTAALVAFRSRLEAIGPAELSEDDRVTHEVLGEQLEVGIAEHTHRAWEWDVDQMFGPQVWLLNLRNWHPVTTETALADLATRCAAFGTFMDHHMADLRAGIASGRTPFRGAVERVIAQCRAHLAKGIDASPLLEGLDAFDAAAFPADGARAALRRACADVVYPALQRYADFLEAELLAVSRSADAPGIAGLPGAAELYAHRIRVHTSTNRTAPELHAIGLAEVRRIRAAMDEIARARGYADLPALSAALAADPGNFYDSRQAVVEHAQALLAAADAHLPDLFGRLPTIPCEVVPIEEYREADSVAAFYNGPPVDRSRPGRYYVNTYQPEERPRYNMPALTIHEAVPGHHLQIALALENTALPHFRRHSHFTAYIEGWALYSERLGEEIGLYATDLEVLGMYTYEAWRACRLVVDTGLHHFGWSRRQAIEFMQQNLALTGTEVLNEVDRYIIWPGQALAYKVGQLEILELRDHARSALGDGFSLKEFHDVILGQGALPLTVLRAVVDRWITSRSTG